MNNELSSNIGKRPSASGAACAVVVAYEDTATRDRAMLLCDHLVNQLWEDLDFELSWWKFDYLSDPQIAAEAAQAVGRADMVIFSAHAGRELPQAVETWVETWPADRDNPESALVALIGMESDLMKGVCPIHVYLREVARRARMDYLIDPREDLSVGGDSSVEAIAQRAGTVTSVMDRILRQANPPSHWGINE
jgi:hypothetical protein